MLVFVLLLALLSTSPILAQSCNNATTRTAPDSRYLDNGDETVSDLQAGLMWMQCSVGLSGAGCASGTASTFTWNLALQQPRTLNSSGGFAGYSDWRLPNVNELETLVELACWSPSINMTFFPNTPGSYYWSSSPFTANLYLAWYVDFDYGKSSNYERIANYAVRLVRSGQ